MKNLKIVGFALVIVMGLVAVSEAGIFRKRNGARRTPVRNTLRGLGGCSSGACR